MTSRIANPITTNHRPCVGRGHPGISPKTIGRSGRRSSAIWTNRSKCAKHLRDATLLTDEELAELKREIEREL